MRPQGYTKNKRQPIKAWSRRGGPLRRRVYPLIVWGQKVSPENIMSLFQTLVLVASVLAGIQFALSQNTLNQMVLQY